jgi:hypothetical protein
MRSLRHTLAQIHRRLSALQEATFERKLRFAKADEQERIGTPVSLIRAEKLRSQASAVEHSMVGAVRDLAALCKLRDEILASLGAETLTPEIVDKMEAEAQVITCLSQCLTSARANRGIVSEGNFIYCQQLGLNGGMVQHRITQYLVAEKAAIDSDKTVSFAAEATFLQELMVEFSQCPLQKRIVLKQRNQLKK